MTARRRPKRLPSEEALLRYVERVSEEAEFARERIYVGNEVYEFLIESWEDTCLEEAVGRDNGDWQDADYLGELAGELHDEVVRTDFLEKYPDCEIIRSDIIDGAQWGVSVIVARLGKDSGAPR